MAFNDARHEIVGLTIAAGNVGLQYTVRNALKLCEVAGRTDIPVFAGAPAPLLHPSPDAGYVHGQDGFGDVGFAPATRQAEDEHAALAILRLSSFELRNRLDVPYRVVINEGIELAKVYGATDGHKFVNGVLDKLAPSLRAAEVKANKR